MYTSKTRHSHKAHTYCLNRNEILFVIRYSKILKKCCICKWVERGLALFPITNSFKLPRYSISLIPYAFTITIITSCLVNLISNFEALFSVYISFCVCVWFGCRYKYSNIWLNKLLLYINTIVVAKWNAMLLSIAHAEPIYWYDNF